MIALSKHILLIPSTNDSVQWFKSYWPSKFSRDLCDHHLTTVQRENNCLVRNCHSLLLHVRVLPPKFCSFRRSGRVLARSIKIVGARLSNQLIYLSDVLRIWDFSFHPAMFRFVGQMFCGIMAL